MVWGSAGDKSDAIIIKDRDSFLHQEGQTVFRWATTALHPVAKEAASVPGSTPPTSRPSSRTRPTCASSRRSPASSAPTTPSSPTTSSLAGNTSAASIPLALSRMIERGEVPSGDLALLLGFGAGLTYAGQVIEIP